VSDRLLLRPGCCFECHGDGTCCTNIHVIGPLNQRDAQRVREAGTIVFPKPRTVVRKDKSLDRLVVVMDQDACVFLDQDARCMIHGGVGPQYKPAPCRRFPVGATATPDGVRVTLSHRCACVSVGRSTPLQEDRARRILVNPWSGKLAHDQVVGDHLRWQRRDRIVFHDYLPWERSMIASLDRDDGPEIEAVLGVADGELPPMRNTDWMKVADKMARWTLDEPFSDGFSCTLRWAEGAIRHGADWLGPFPRRPWGWTFDRAARREPDEGIPRRIYGSWQTSCGRWPGPRVGRCTRRWRTWRPATGSRGGLLPVSNAWA
jgi:Fe-S-cluster containining protein